MGNAQSVNGSVPKQRRQRQDSPQSMHPIWAPLEAVLPSPLRPPLPPRTSPTLISVRLLGGVGVPGVAPARPGCNQMLSSG